MAIIGDTNSIHEKRCPTPQCTKASVSSNIQSPGIIFTHDIVQSNKILNLRKTKWTKPYPAYANL